MVTSFGRWVRVSTMALAASVVVAACGDDASESSGTSGSASSQLCDDLCAAQSAGCSELGADQAKTCAQTCPSIPATCGAAYDAMASCQLAVGFVCSTTVTINGKPAAESKDSSKCTDEISTFLACSQGTSGGMGMGTKVCNDACTAQATGCTEMDTGLIKGCKQFCSLVPEKCRQAHDAKSSCEIAVGFTCSATAKVNGKPVAELNDKAKCTDEIEAFDMCSQK